MRRWNRNLPLGECFGNLGRPLSGNAHTEYFSDHLGGILVHNPVVLVSRVFEVTIRRVGTQGLTGLTFGLKHRADFLAGVLGIPFVDNVEERGKITVLLIGAVHAVIDGDKPDIGAGQYNLGVVAYPAYKKGQLNVSELARVCNISRTTAYKYINLLES